MHLNAQGEHRDGEEVLGERHRSLGMVPNGRVRINRARFTERADVVEGARNGPRSPASFGRLLLAFSLETAVVTF
jgi:hypothetical protein